MDDYPARFTLEAEDRIANWRPLVQWLLAIPHALIVEVLDSLGTLIGVISWFAILFTGRLPEGLANLQCLVLRYSLRTYTYMLWLHDEYPPFAFDVTPSDPGGTPAVVEIEPELEDRNRLTVGLRLIWIIPILIVGLLILVASFFLAIIAFFAVLFTGRWPEGPRNFLLGAFRFHTRLFAYAWLLTDRYPPYSMS